MDAALRIADAEGVDALSMRRLAAEFGVTAMALYRHVGNKEAVLDLVAERVIAALPDLDHSGEWQAEIARFFTAWHQLFLEHPAAAYIMSRQSLAVPSMIRHGEDALVMLLNAGFEDVAAIEAMIALGNYTLGASLYELGHKSRVHPIREAPIEPGEAPVIHRMREQIAGAAGEAQFLSGLHHLIRGYEEASRNSSSGALSARAP